MAKHTEGPWELCNDRDGFWIERHGVSICTVSHESSNAGLGDGEGESNGRLLASAPELLDALQACVFALGRAGANVIDGPARAEWEQAQRAIGKATGR